MAACLSINKPVEMVKEVDEKGTNCCKSRNYQIKTKSKDKTKENKFINVIPVFFN